MTCPRCGLDLRKEGQDGVEVDRCPSCWGTWLDKGEFSLLMGSAARSLRFTEEEIDSVFKGMAHEANAPKPVPDRTLCCPRCGKAMGKVRHNAVRVISLDRCDAHGLWLDARELKQAQVSAQALKLLLSRAESAQ